MMANQEPNLFEALKQLEDAVLELGLLFFGEAVLDYPYEDFLSNLSEWDSFGLVGLGAHDILLSDLCPKTTMSRIRKLYEKHGVLHVKPRKGSIPNTAYEGMSSLHSIYNNLRSATHQCGILLHGIDHYRDAEKTMQTKKLYLYWYAKIAKEMHGLFFTCRSNADEFCAKAASLYDKYADKINAASSDYWKNKGAQPRP